MNSCFYIFYYSVSLNLFRYFELFTTYLNFSELSGIHRSVTLSRIHSLHQMIARDFVKLKSSVKNISHPFRQAEYHVFSPCIFTLLLLCLFSKNKTAIIAFKRRKYQPRNTNGFIARKKSNRFNLVGWVITFKIILTYFLVAYKSEKMRLYVPLLQQNRTLIVVNL